MSITITGVVTNHLAASLATALGQLQHLFQAIGNLLHRRVGQVADSLVDHVWISDQKVHARSDGDLQQARSRLERGVESDLGAGDAGAVYKIPAPRWR